MPTPSPSPRWCLVEEYDAEFTFNGTVISEYNQELFRLYVDYDDQPGRLAQSCTDAFAQEAHAGSSWTGMLGPSHMTSMSTLHLAPAETVWCSS